MTDEATTEAAPAPFRVEAPGFYQLTREQYLADPCPEPSLNSSTAWTIVEECPALAAWKHPRLNPQHQPEEGANMDRGSIAHAIVLEGSTQRVRVIKGVNDWRTNAAKDARDAVRAKGLLPILESDYADVLAMTGGLRLQLDAHREGRAMFRNGQAEVTAIWTEEINGATVWCRALLDYLRMDLTPYGIDDYKTIKGSANPERVSKTLATTSALMQSAWYQRGVQVLIGKRVPFRFCYQECEPPYLASVNALGAELEIIGDRMVLLALDRWQRCLETGHWPGYGNQTALASCPPWVEESFMRKEVEFGV